MIHSSGYPLRLAVWEVDRVFAHAAVQWRREKSTDYVRCVFFCTANLKTSVLQHSIGDMAQFDDELERNLLHTDS